MLRTSLKAFAASIVGLSLFVAAHVDAAPDFHRSGTACRPNNGDVGKINYTDNQGVMNVSTSGSATVYCPVDYTAPLDTTIPRTLRVVVIDRSSDAVTCTVKHTFSDGTDVKTIGPQSSSGNDGNKKVLTFNISSANTSRLFFNLYCTIPKAGSSSGNRSHVVSYKLTSS